MHRVHAASMLLRALQHQAVLHRFCVGASTYRDMLIWQLLIQALAVLLS